MHQKANVCFGIFHKLMIHSHALWLKIQKGENQ